MYHLRNNLLNVADASYYPVISMHLVIFCTIALILIYDIHSIQSLFY